MYYIFFAVSLIITISAQIYVNSSYNKYSKVKTNSGETGEKVARKILDTAGLDDVAVLETTGILSDHYDPRHKAVFLSSGNFNGSSVGAASVAAHECGHAVQHAMGYAPLRMRSALVPVVSFASNIVQWVLLAGVLFINTFPGLLWFGIILFATTTLFSFITLPVEINASSRAISWLSSTGITDSRTQPMAVDALKWAAYTYVVAALGSLATLLYYIGLARRD